MYSVQATYNPATVDPKFNDSSTTTAADLTIGKRPIAIAADATSKTYGDPDPPLTYEITTGSLVNGDTFSGSLTRDEGESVGAYPILQGTLTAGDNYSLTHVTLRPT